MPTLLARLRATAPGVSLRLRPINRISVLDELDAGSLDLGIGVFTQGQNHHKRRSLYAENFLCLFSPDQLKLSPPISLEDYLRVPACADEPQRRRSWRRGRGTRQAQAQAHDRDDDAGLSRRALRAPPRAGDHHHAVAARALLRRGLRARHERCPRSSFQASPSRCFGMRVSTRIRGISGSARRCRGLPRRWVWSSERARRGVWINVDMSASAIRLASSWRLIDSRLLGVGYLINLLI